ncbi:MAG: hypothetical protein V3V20_01005 [Algisphaera sp.]
MWNPIKQQATLRFLAPLPLLTLFITLSATANQIDLSTVPSRDSVQLTIYNSEDLTLVRETRRVVFKTGNNPLQFSWANTLIDPTSVQLRFLSHTAELDVLDTTFPHDRPQELTWNVASEYAGDAMIEISYFTSGIHWQASYDVFVAPDESTAQMLGHVTIRNHSGEPYPDAQVRLVVGTINLVERVAELARQSGRRLDDLSKRDQNEFKMKVAREMVMEADSLGSIVASNAPKQIVKQGLSEYFIFTIEGTETLPDQSQKRLPSFRADHAPLKVVHRYRPHQYGDYLAQFLLMKNDTDSEMGVSPLPNGQVNVFRRSNTGSLSYLATQNVPYIPVGEDIELNLGEDPNVGFELITQRTFRTDLWLRLHGARIEHRADAPGIRFDSRSRVVGWDQHTVYTRRVRNDTPRPITLDIRQPVAGDATFVSTLNPTRHDHQTIVLGGPLNAGERYDILYEVITRHGRNAKQNQVTIVNGNPASPIAPRI